ncbi:MAG: alanine--tRNA ligase [Patescibacteria group bacterium]
MTITDLRAAFLAFFEEKGHAVIPSASLLPENDPTVLFTTAGMHPLVPYLVGQPHPMGNRLVDAQKCLRTDDIDDVGDNRHLTFFEMLGNWSLGDYFKREAIAWSFEFLVERVGLDPKRLFVSVFEGDADAPRDEESIGIWQSQFEVKGISAEVGSRIYAYPKKMNWWGPAGLTGPCGPDTEMFYDTGRDHDVSFGPMCHPNCDCGRFVEIWNDVFMEYEKMADGRFVPLNQKNVDTGMGLERMAAVTQGVATVFDTEAFTGIMSAISEASGKTYGDDDVVDRSFRIISDHLRAATFVIGDQRGVEPSNVGQGYIVRRLIRRAIREARRLGIEGPIAQTIASVVIGEYGADYAELETNRTRILDAMGAEESKFGKTLEKGLKQFEKMMKDHVVSGTEAFDLFQTYGFPLELTQELIGERGGNLDVEAFRSEFAKHQDLSRTASAGTFKGGLADHGEETTRLHTATHLLHAALRKVLGSHVAQKGSNITPERLRFDFVHPTKMTPEELKAVEDEVNAVIEADLPVERDETTVEAAKDAGAIGLFEQKYGDKVSVYTVAGFSKEICGGPHIAKTGELGNFSIIKEEAVSAGVRRIKATVSGPGNAD